MKRMSEQQFVENAKQYFHRMRENIGLSISSLQLLDECRTLHDVTRFMSNNTGDLDDIMLYVLEITIDRDDISHNEAMGD